MQAGLKKNSVQETLLIPLRARAEFSRRHPELFFDPDALRLARKLGLGPSGHGASGYGGLLYAVRQDALIASARRYLELRPEATVVNLGCGLDTSFSGADNGSCRWVSLDLPEVIDFRRGLLAPREREEYLACDALDLSWLRRVDGSKGLFVIAGGVFYYFRPERIRALLCALAEHFPDGGICFDCEGALAAAVSSALVYRSGNTGAPMYFSVRNAERLFRPWSARFGEIRTINRLPEKYARRGALPARLRLPLSLFMRCGALKFVEIGFAA